MKRVNRIIGRFEKKVTAQDFTTTSDGAGGLTQTWADTHTFFVDIEPQTGREALEAEQLIGKKPYKMTARYSSEVAGLTNETRIKFGDRYFNIHSIINLNEDNEFLEIIAWEE